MIEIPSKVESVLESALKRVRRLYVLRGAAASAAVFVFGVLAVMAVDAKITIYSDPVRLCMSLAVYLSSAAVCYFAAWRPLSRGLDRLKMAKILDSRHEENEECLTSLLELAASEARGESLRVSPSLVRLLAERAVNRAALIDVEKEFTARGVKRRLVLLASAVAVLLLTFAAVPRLAGMLFIRAVAPWVDVGNLYSGAIEVTPGDIDILAGGEIVIKAAVDGDFGYVPHIRISRRTAIGWSGESSEPMNGGVYRATADLSDGEWRYRVSAGPAVTRYFVVRVHENPSCRLFSARIDYPSYTGFSPLVVTNDSVSSIRAIEGSRVTFTAELAPSAAKAELLVAGRPADGWTMVSNKVVNWSLVLENAAGLRSPPRRGTLESFPDMPPSVIIEKPNRAVKVPHHAKIPVVVTAADDTLVVSNRLLVKIGDRPWKELRPLESFSRAGASLWKGGDELDLSLLDLTGEAGLQFAVSVTDQYPAEKGGPHSVTSTPVKVSLESRADSFSLQSLAAEEKNLKAKIDEAKKRLAAAVRPTWNAKAMIDREKNVSEAADREIAKAAHEVDEAYKRLDEFRKAVSKDPRLKPLEKNVCAAVEEKMSPVVGNFEAAQFAAREERRKALAGIPGKLQEAQEAVRKMEKEFGERMADLKNHERMVDLARRQKALAETARAIGEAEAAKRDPRMLEAWKRLQQEASAKAAELARFKNDAGIDEARRRMDRAAALMDEEKRLAEARKRLGKNERALSEYEKGLERAAESAVQQAMRRALEEAKKAERSLAAAAGMQKPRPAADAMFRAMLSQRTSQDELEKAGLSDAGRREQHEAEKAVRSALDAAAEAKMTAAGRDDNSRKAFREAVGEMDAQLRKAMAHQSRARERMEKALKAAAKADGPETADGLKAAGKAEQASELMRLLAGRDAKELGIEDVADPLRDDAREEGGEVSCDGFASELKRRMGDISRALFSGDIKGLLRREGWFLIRGSAKDGLGTAGMKDVPAEYRDMVQMYFLKLAEEAK